MCLNRPVSAVLVQALEPKGLIVHSTCSLSENFEFATDALGSWGGNNQTTVTPQLQQHMGNPVTGVPFAMQKPLQELAAKEPQSGVNVLPDEAGSGPMYVSIIHKH